VDQRLKRLTEELGEAINESLTESERISEVIAKINAGGYDVSLLLNATIGFRKREEERGEPGDRQVRVQVQPPGHQVPQVVAHQRG
jgi:hypothetical protein